MEREWRDALLITEPSACSWTTSNSTGSWAEERERGERERGTGAGIQRGGEREEEKEWDGSRGGRERDCNWLGMARGQEREERDGGWRGWRG